MKIGTKEILRDYYGLLFPNTLSTDEYVNLVMMGNGKNGKDVSFQKFVKNYDEFEDYVKKYRHRFNIYVRAATVKENKNGKRENLNRRRVLFLDFDKKDNPDLKTIEDVTARIKTRMPKLFNHCIVDSGNGFHVYIAICSERATSKVADVNKELARILGADMKACLSTQIVRVPTSYNLKNGDKKLVTMINNTYGTAMYKQYKLNEILSQIGFYKRNECIDENTPSKPTLVYDSVSYSYCTLKMLNEGVDKTERNFALGRIVNYLKLKGYTESATQKRILEWNLTCRPPKNEKEVKLDFENYWAKSNEYKLLGCKLSNEVDQKILDKYCDQYLCKSTYEKKSSDILIDSREVEFGNLFLNDKYLKDLNGYCYLILTILHLFPNGLTLDELKKELTAKNYLKKEQIKPCMSVNTLRKVLKILIFNCKFVEYKENGLRKQGFMKKRCDFYRLKVRINYKGYTRFYYSASILLINNLITQTDYLVYLCLVRNLQSGQNISEDTISDNLGMHKGNVSRNIKSLHDSGILKIEQRMNEKGLYYNHYTLLA